MPITDGTVTIPIPLPVSWRTSHAQYKGVGQAIGSKRLSVILNVEEYNKLEQLSDTLGVDMTNLFRQVVSSLHKELCGVPKPGSS